jgi:periplasmic divalent cation tolerance protein
VTDSPETDAPDDGRGSRAGGATDIIAALTEEFRQGLPARIARIREGIAAWHDRGEATGLDDAERAAHSLAGAAGSFGFPWVGEAARQLERLLEGAQAGAPGAAEVNHALSVLALAVDGVASLDAPERPLVEEACVAARPMVAYVTCGSREEALTIGRTLVEERLAACCNLIAGMTAIYRWEGSIETGEEVVLIAKTTADRLELLTTRVNALHSYELPCISAWPIEGGSAGFLAWIARECHS